jgi:hypothetical protein
MSIGLAEPRLVGHGRARIAERCSWGIVQESCPPLQDDERVDVVSLEKTKDPLLRWHVIR